MHCIEVPISLCAGTVLKSLYSLKFNCVLVAICNEHPFKNIMLSKISVTPLKSIFCHSHVTLDNYSIISIFGSHFEYKVWICTWQPLHEFYILIVHYSAIFYNLP